MSNVLQDFFFCEWSALVIRTRTFDSFLFIGCIIIYPLCGLSRGVLQLKGDDRTTRAKTGNTCTRIVPSPVMTEAWAADENPWSTRAEVSDDSSSGVRSPPTPPWSRVSGLWRCNRCMYTAPDIYRIKRHQVTHTGERRYYCPICQARFTAKQSVKIHMRRHTGERPYACTMCPARFTRQQRLARHLETCGSMSFEQAV